MATNIRDKKRVLVGNGAPVDGDQLTSNNSAYPLDSVYVDQDTGSVYVRKDVTKDASTDWALGGGDGTPTVQTVYSRKTTLTDAQIKALPSNYIELVPAPGANKTLVFHSARLVFKIEGGAYTNKDTNNVILVGYGNWDADASTETPMPDATSMATLYGAVVPETRGGLTGSFMLSYASSITYFDNKPLVLAADNLSSDYTGGNAANTLEVTVFYSIVDL